MGLPSWLVGGKPKKTTAPGLLAAQGGVGGTPGMFGNAPRTPNGLLAPPPAPANAVATAGGFAATNAARRQRKIAAASSSSATAKPAPAQTPTPPKLRNAGLAAMGLY